MKRSVRPRVKSRLPASNFYYLKYILRKVALSADHVRDIEFTCARVLGDSGVRGYDMIYVSGINGFKWASFSKFHKKRRNYWLFQLVKFQSFFIFPSVTLLVAMRKVINQKKCSESEEISTLYFDFQVSCMKSEVIPPTHIPLSLSKDKCVKCQNHSSKSFVEDVLRSKIDLNRHF